MIRPGDVVIVLAGVALVVALAVRVHSDASPTTLQVMQNGSLVEHPLWEDERFVVAGPLGRTVIEIRDGRARFVESPCTNRLCLRAGWLEDAGDAAACVPNRVSLALRGADARFDAMNF